MHVDIQSNPLIMKKSLKDFNEMTKLLKIISDKNRLRILYLLKDGPKCVCEIWPALNLRQNLTSHHLKILSETDLIESNKQGLKVFYKLNNKTINQQLINLQSFLNQK